MYLLWKEWKVDGAVNWADDCDFNGQDLTYIPNSKKKTCSQFCLANPQCDHYTWSAVNKVCWLKKWSGSGPRLNSGSGARCGFIQTNASTTGQQSTTTTTQKPPQPQSTIAIQRPSTYGIGDNEWIGLMKTKCIFYGQWYLLLLN